VQEKKRTSVVDDDVAGLARGVGADHAGAGDDLADEGVLLLGDVDLDLGLVPVAVLHHGPMLIFLNRDILTFFAALVRPRQTKNRNITATQTSILSETRAAVC
jgi:hypothetical protein